jgi:energy-coupling factor transport system permease protein
MRQQRDVQLFRYVPSSSLTHRMWAGTKLACLVALSVTTLAKPAWTTIGTIAVVTVLYVLGSRLPRGVVPRAPRWLWIGIVLSGFFAFLAFGEPEAEVFGTTIGFGGLLDFLRFSVLGLVLVALALLLGWTTQLADIASAVDRLAAPARLVRLPVDEVVLVIGLAVRCLPMLADDVRVLRAAWHVRAPVREPSLRGRFVEVRDLVVAALVSSLRRAREMAEAIDARGGPHRAPRGDVRLGGPDVIAAIATALAVAVIVVA